MPSGLRGLIVVAAAGPPVDDPTWGALLDNLHVIHDMNGRGVGTRLMAETATMLTERRPSSGLYLWVLDQNKAAQTFYAAGGICAERKTSIPPGGGTIVGLRYAWADLRRSSPADNDDPPQGSPTSRRPAPVVHRIGRPPRPCHRYGPVDHDVEVVIDLRAVGDRYVVTVSPPHSPEPWSSPRPLTSTEVLEELARLGCHSTDITDALEAAGSDWRAAHDVEVRRRRGKTADE